MTLSRLAKLEAKQNKFITIDEFMQLMRNVITCARESVKELDDLKAFERGCVKIAGDLFKADIGQVAEVLGVEWNNEAVKT